MANLIVNILGKQLHNACYLRGMLLCPLRRGDHAGVDLVAENAVCGLIRALSQNDVCITERVKGGDTLPVIAVSPAFLKVEKMLIRFLSLSLCQSLKLCRAPRAAKGRRKPLT